MNNRKNSRILYFVMVLFLVSLGTACCVLAFFPGWFNIPTTHWGVRRAGLLLAGILMLTLAAAAGCGKTRPRLRQVLNERIIPGFAKGLSWLACRRRDMFFYFLAASLFLLAVFLFGRTLTCYPGTGDDLHKLGSVYSNPNPLSYFIGEQGAHPSGPNYRPLTTTTWWILERIFGMSFTPQQIFNFILHFVNTGLVYLLLSKLNPNRYLALILAGVYLFGIYSTQVPLDIAHRAGGLVDLWLLLMLLYLDRVFPEQVTGKTILFLVGLCLLAFLSRENGVILPLIIFIIGFLTEKSFPYRRQWMVCGVAALLFYFGLRWLAMGPALANYSNYGYLAGVYYYDYPADLPGLWRYLAFADVLLKNLAAPVIQGFIKDGGELNQAWVISRLLMWISSAFLFITAASKRLTKWQKWAVVLIGLNAAVHFVLFRYRNLDIGQFAALIFIAAASVNSKAVRGWRRKMVHGMAVLLLISSAAWTWGKSDELVDRNLWAPAYFGSTDNEYKQHWSNQFERPLVEIILNTCALPEALGE